MVPADHGEHGPAGRHPHSRTPALSRTHPGQEKIFFIRSKNIFDFPLFSGQALLAAPAAALHGRELLPGAASEPRPLPRPQHLQLAAVRPPRHRLTLSLQLRVQGAHGADLLRKDSFLRKNIF